MISKSAWSMYSRYLSSFSMRLQNWRAMFSRCLNACSSSESKMRFSRFTCFCVPLDTHWIVYRSSWREYPTT